MPSAMSSALYIPHISTIYQGIRQTREGSELMESRPGLGFDCVSVNLCYETVEEERKMAPGPEQ